jgi:hypothetical protein
MKLPLAFLIWSLAATAQTRTPILLELFTSEGCSSCPPADKLLEALDRQPIPGADLIVLGEHVDYWDGAWRDRFSSPAFTKRQWDYAKYFRLQGVYTPQLIVDGKREFVGSHTAGAAAAIEQALKSHKHPIQLSATANGNKLQATIQIQNLASKGATVFLALAENQSQSQVTRGENAGSLLNHTAAVRSLQAIGAVTNDFDKTVELPIPANTKGLRVVAFVQDRATGHILAIHQLKL